MSNISVSSHGLRFWHEIEFVVDRPYGLGCYLLLRFHSPMKFLVGNEIQRVHPGDCILVSPERPQWYCGLRDPWTNDWMHLEGDEVGRVAAQYGVPLDTLLEPGDTRFLPRLFDEITHEQQQAEASWENAVDLLARQLMLKLGRALSHPTEQFTPAESEHLRVLRALRWRVHEQLSQPWTVTKMAREAGLSASRFAALYQRFFGVSPLEDLLRARLQRAQYLLTNRAMSVSEAAAQSGFRSVSYFSHVFHQRVGCAPRDYYRRGSLWAGE